MNGFDTFPLISFLIVVILISGRVVYLKQKGITVGSGNDKKKKSLFFLYLIFFLIQLLWLFEIAKPAFHITFSILPKTITVLFTDSFFLKITGIILISAALIFLSLTLLHFKNSLRFGYDNNNRAELITTGIFSITRNPFFVSLDLYFLGIALFLPSIFFVSFSFLTIFSIHFFILKEEKFMMEIYGKDYESYRKAVRRYF